MGTLPGRAYVIRRDVGTPLAIELKSNLRRVCIRTSVVSVAKAMGFNPSTIYALLNGGRATHKTEARIIAYLEQNL